MKKVIFEIHTLAEYLSLLGHKIYAIDYESMWYKSSTLDLFSTKSIHHNVSRVYPEASVTLIRPSFIKIPVLSRLSAFFSHFYEINSSIKEKNIDVIILYSVPTNGLQTAYLSKKYDIPLIFRAIDIPNQLVPYSILSSTTRLIEKVVYSRADQILTLSPKLSDYVIKMGANKKKVDLLPLGVDTRQFHPSIDCTALKKTWNINEHEPVILFLGTLFNFSGIDTFLPYFSQIKKEIPKVKFLIVGDGPQRPKLEKIIKDMRLTKEVIITGFQPFNLIPSYINIATIGINPFQLTGATRDIFPGKIIQFLACGKALIATPLPGMKALLPENGCGVVYAANPVETVNQMLFLLRSPDHRHRLEEDGLSYIKLVHSYDNIARRLGEFLKQAVESKNHKIS